MRLSSIFLGLVLAASTPACSSNDTHGGHDGGSSSGGDGGGTAQDAGGSASTDSGGAAAQPAAPVLNSVGKMTGALHVMWTNKEPACDSIEGERKTSTVAYAVAFTVPGEADNKHDMGATQNTTYTYRLRCKKGGAYSVYSNEMSGNPQ